METVRHRHLDATTATCAVEQPDHGQAHLPGVFLEEYLLCMNGGIARTRTQRKIVRADNHLATFKMARSGNEVHGRQCVELALFVVSRKRRQARYFFEAVRVDKRINALANVHLAFGFLTSELGRPAHSQSKMTPLLDLLDFLGPTQVFSGRIQFLTSICRLSGNADAKEVHALPDGIALVDRYGLDDSCNRR